VTSRIAWTCLPHTAGYVHRKQKFKRRAESSAATLLGRRIADRGDLGFEDRHLGRSEGKGSRLPRKLPRSRDVEVILERLGVFPLFDEHDPELILEVTVNTVQDAPRLQARALNVRQAQLQDAVDRVWSGFDASGHDQHVTMVPKRVIS
jgi:hypothetical protein